MGFCLIDTADLEKSVRRTRDASASLEVQDRGIKDTRAALRAHGYRQSAKRPQVLQSSIKCLLVRSNGPRSLSTTRLERFLPRLSPPDTTQTYAHPPSDIPLRNNTYA